MPILHKHQRQTYTIVDNEALRDPKLSWRATGMLAYLLSLPDNWNVNIEDLTRRKTDGRTAARSTLQELKDAGYVVLEETRDERGQFHRVLHVHETCQSVIDQNQDENSLFTDDGLPDFGSTDFGDPDTKKDLERITDKEKPKDIKIAKRDEYWDTLTDLLGKPTPNQQSLQGRLVARIKADGHPPGEILVRAERLAAAWGPEKLTLASLEKHWERWGVPLAGVTKQQMADHQRQRELADALRSLE